MKKAGIILLAVLYITVTSGVMVNIHYCMGKVASVKYGLEKDERCDKCGMQQKAGCCHTDHKLLKSDQAHFSVNNHFVAGVALLLLPVEYNLFPGQRYQGRDHYNSLYHSPPDSRENSLHIYNGVFRI